MVFIAFDHGKNKVAETTAAITTNSVAIQIQCNWQNYNVLTTDTDFIVVFGISLSEHAYSNVTNRGNTWTYKKGRGIIPNMFNFAGCVILICVNNIYMFVKY